MSGGQTGVNRAALDVALELGIPRGGVHGVIPAKMRYPRNHET